MTNHIFNVLSLISHVVTFTKKTYKITIYTDMKKNIKFLLLIVSCLMTNFSQITTPQLIDGGVVKRLSATSKQFLLIDLNNLRSQVKSIKSQTKLHVYCKHGSGCTPRKLRLYFQIIQTIYLFYQTKIMIQKKKYSFI